ncbi:MAG: penicillin-binding protein 2 [Pseudoruegeria sp.]
MPTAYLLGWFWHLNTFVLGVDQGDTDPAARNAIVSGRRIFVIATVFLLAFSGIAFRFVELVVRDVYETRVFPTAGNTISSRRADLTDRYGRILATNIEGHVLYAQPQRMFDPIRAADKLSEIFPDLDRQALWEDFTDSRRFHWVKRMISPAEAQAVYEIGEPGLLFSPRDVRFYPNGSIAAHLLGGTTFGREGVSAAEVIGTAGVEKYLDDRLRGSETADEPVRLSIDTRIQKQIEGVLHNSLALTGAKGASAILLDATSGEILALVSLPNFNPNSRPRPRLAGEIAEDPLFNMAIQGVYELGRPMTIFTLAQAIDLRVAELETEVDVSQPLEIGAHRIRELFAQSSPILLKDILPASSNTGSARVALWIGPQQQSDFFRRLGLLSPLSVELIEASTGRPLTPRRWSEISAATISYGHGISLSSLHLAVGYGAIANGGYKVTPTVLKTYGASLGERVMSEKASAASLEILRSSVTDGRAGLADVRGYNVAASVGLVEKPSVSGGGYDSERLLATLAAVFPGHAPRFVLTIVIDEPDAGKFFANPAGVDIITAPVAAEIIRGTMPLLRTSRPQIEHSFEN